MRAGDRKQVYYKPWPYSLSVDGVSYALDKYKCRGTPCRDPKLIIGHLSEIAVHCV